MSVIILVDCNNFFVSCERVFNPRLKNKPVIVLSNNDGCVISRSNEAKALGIAMGVPFFKIRSLVKQNNIYVFSANFTLYGDMSTRVMETLRQFTPHLERYSIDEAFLELTIDKKTDLETLGRQIHQTVKQWTGIPTAVGIAPTKTLAKIASEFAKKSTTTQGVMVLMDTALQQAVLRQMPIGDVWNIGPRIADKLKRRQIYNALQLSQMPDDWVLKQLTITGLKTTCELRGIKCLPVETVYAPHKTVLCSRSFGKLVESLNELKAAIIMYTTRAAEKLREDNLTAGQITVYIRTSKHRKDLPQYGKSIVVPIHTPTNCSHELIHLAVEGLQKIYASGFRYYKAGVVLSNLLPATHVQQNLLDNVQEKRNKWQHLMKTLDTINLDNGQGTIRYAAEGYQKSWQMKRNFKSRHFTTDIDELLEAKA